MFTTVIRCTQSYIECTQLLRFLPVRYYLIKRKRNRKAE